MEVTYKCNKCDSCFIEPLIENGIFVCPSCNEPEFEKLECKKYMHDCCD